MELLVGEGSLAYCVQKVQVAASFAGVEISIRESVSNDELLKLCDQSRGMLLKHEGQYLSQHNAILRLIAQVNPAAGIYGAEFDAAQVCFLRRNLQSLFSVYLTYLTSPCPSIVMSRWTSGWISHGASSRSPCRCSRS